jgi:hypothetical protein
VKEGIQAAEKEQNWYKILMRVIFSEIGFMMEMNEKEFQPLAISME